MYGKDLPLYAREYIREWRRYDRFLRLRRSLDTPGMYILERKTHYMYDPEDEIIWLPSDRSVQLKDSYRMIMRFWPNEIKDVGTSLMITDIQRLGGAKRLAERIDEAEDNERRTMERYYQGEREAAGCEAYDRLAWLEGRRIAT